MRNFRLNVLKRETSNASTSGVQQLAPSKEMDARVSLRLMQHANDLFKKEIRQELEAVGEQEAQLIFYIPDGVQLFTIDVSLSFRLNIDRFRVTQQLLRPIPRRCKFFAFKVLQMELRLEYFKLDPGSIR